MRALFKYVLILVSILAISYAGGRIYNHLTDGFFLSKIQYTKPYNPLWIADSSFIKKNSHAFDQTYSYLGKGHQTFVFKSDDGNYVIKFLKCHLVEIKPWLAYLPLPSSFEYLRERRLKAKEARLASVLNAWKIAEEHLKEETGVVGIHINPSGLFSKKLKVKNKSGWVYEIDLNQTAFILQRKVDMFIPVYESKIAEGNVDSSRELLKNLLGVYVRINTLGISDNDPQIMRNTGVSKDKPILIDIGRLMNSETIKTHSNSMDEIKQKTLLFDLWLQEKYPDEAIYFETLLAEMRESDD